MSAFQCTECNDRQEIICKDCDGKGVRSDSLKEATMIVCPACYGQGEHPCTSCQEPSQYVSAPYDHSEAGCWYRTITSGSKYGS